MLVPQLFGLHSDRFLPKNSEPLIWLVVSTQLKNISQNGNLPQIGVKIKNCWNHRLVTIPWPSKLYSLQGAPSLLGVVKTQNIPVVFGHSHWHFFLSRLLRLSLNMVDPFEARNSQSSTLLPASVQLQVSKQHVEPEIEQLQPSNGSREFLRGKKSRVIPGNPNNGTPLMVSYL